MKEININVTKREIYNAKNSSLKAEDFIDQELELRGIYTFEDDVANKETGEVERKQITALITDKGVIASPSTPLANCVNNLVDTFDEDEIIGMAVMIEERKSNAGNKFFQLAIL